jgi:hypothetical protein
MKINHQLALAVMAFALHSAAFGASWVVSSGQSLQAAIDTAAAGDNITVMTGTYNENLTISKGIDIRGSGGTVQVTGTLTITNVPLPVYLADILLGKSGASGITITGSSNVRFDRCNLTNSGSLSATGSKLYFYKQTFTANATFTANCDWTMQRCTITGNVDSSNSTAAKFIGSTIQGTLNHNNGEITVFQSNFNGTNGLNMTLATNQSGWVAYNRLYFLNWTGGAAQIVGNHFDGRSRNDFFLQIGGGCNANVRNNFMNNDGRVYRSPGPNWWDGASAIRVLGNAGLVKIINNSIANLYRGIEVQGAPVGVEIRANYFEAGASTEYAVSTGTAGTIIDSNNFRAAVNGGTQTNNINAAPAYVNGDWGQGLTATSAGKNAGPSDPIYNDLDGTRNDIGATGGHAYDPTGGTTTKPVVLSGEVSPLYVKRGQAVTIKARAAVIANP